jgi:hypothetical protein
MTESEWLECTRPHPMLRYMEKNDLPVALHERIWNDRKLRLFACAYCRDIWDLLNPHDRYAVQVAERYADGNATVEEMLAAARHAYTGYAAGADRITGWVWCVTRPDIPYALRQTVERYNRIPPAVQASLIRETIGNPFQPTWTLPKNWNQASGFHWTIMSLAESAYVGYMCSQCNGKGWVYNSRICTGCSPDGKSFGNGWVYNGTLDPLRLAVLADAVEEHGWGDEAILTHLRSPGPHPRGCWALDIFLDRTVSQLSSADYPQASFDPIVP